MATTDLSSYKNLYLQTAKEYMDKISVSLVQLSGDAFNKEALNNLHIASHSLKSQSQVMGFTNIASLSSIIEKIAVTALAGNYEIRNDLIVVLKESAEALSLCLSQIEKENKEKELSFMVKKLGEYVK